MSGKLIIKAVTKFTVGILLVGLLLFVPAGTFRYPGAWLFMGSLFIPMPLVLGSLISFFIFIAYPVIVVRRIYSEETLLGRELAGYAAYCEKVRFRLIPYIW